jgi:hypothetical protein
MGKRNPNPRRVKIHHNYSVEEIARLFDIHKNTVRRWIQDGLRTIDEKRPFLILGTVLRAFLEGKRKKSKRPCPPGFMYCFRCREPREPAGRTAVVVPMAPGIANLSAYCSTCTTAMHRRVSLPKLDLARGNLILTAADASSRIGGTSVPSSNGALDEKEPERANT